MYGRWTVIRAAAPAQQGSETYQRRRVIVRCVCGTERAMFVVKLVAGSTGGCRACAGRARAADRVRLLLAQLGRVGGHVADLREALEARVESWLAEGPWGVDPPGSRASGGIVGDGNPRDDRNRFRAASLRAARPDAPSDDARASRAEGSRGAERAAHQRGRS